MFTNHPVFIIVAVDENYGIGNGGKLPWHFTKELQFFKKTTTQTSDPEKQNMLIMGRKTWESIDPKYRPLPNRKNAVLTRDIDFKSSDAQIFHSLDQALGSADESIERIFIIGGAQVFSEALNHQNLSGIYLTKILHIHQCDTFLDPSKIPQKFSSIKKIGSDEENGIRFDYFLHTPQKPEL